MISGGKFGNRCKDFPVYTFFRASILDFKPRLENRCSAIAATVRNGSACSGRGGIDLPRPTLFFVAAKENSPPAVVAAARKIRLTAAT